MENISPEQINTLRTLINDSVEIVEEEDEQKGKDLAEDEVQDNYEEIADDVECPECQTSFSLDMTGVSGSTVNCPNCGAELELSYERDEEVQEE